MFDKITKKNWLFYAIKNYNVTNLDSEQEFYEDVKRFKYLKRLFRKYKTTGELKTRLVLNHIIVLTNVFGNEAAATLLLFKIERAIDLLITYRVIKMLVTPWKQHDAYKLGIIDDNGKVLRKAKTLKSAKE